MGFLDEKCSLKFMLWVGMVPLFMGLPETKAATGAGACVGTRGCISVPSNRGSFSEDAQPCGPTRRTTGGRVSVTRKGSRTRKVTSVWKAKTKLHWLLTWNQSNMAAEAWEGKASSFLCCWLLLGPALLTSLLGRPCRVLQNLGLLSKGLIHSGVSHRSQPSALYGKHLKCLKQIQEDGNTLVRVQVA